MRMFVSRRARSRIGGSWRTVSCTLITSHSPASASTFQRGRSMARAFRIRCSVSICGKRWRYSSNEAPARSPSTPSYVDRPRSISASSARLR
uniref:Putative secreted protein n=1 Tax=Anopheles darlingi TaxID=43151 RepID=A0A2M4DAT5_ANODA